MLTALAEQVRRGESVPTMVLTPEGEPKDFSFLPIEQYGDAMKTAGYPSISELLDAFYGERDTADRMKQRMSDFSRLITSRIERTERKLCAQKEELIACRDRDRAAPLRRFAFCFPLPAGEGNGKRDSGQLF